MGVMKTPTTLTVDLHAHGCTLRCTQNTGARHTSGSDLEVQGLEVFGRGKSKWKQQPPHPSCGTVQLLRRPSRTQTPRSCTKPPPLSSTAPPPHPSTEHTAQQDKQGTSSSTESPACGSRSNTLTYALVGAAEVVVVAITLAIVAFIIRNSRQQQK